MSRDEVQHGLRRLAALGPEFEVGQPRFDDDSFPLRLEGRLAAEVSREIIEDLRGSPELEDTLSKGLQLAREETKMPHPRVVQIRSAGAGYKTDTDSGTQG